MTADFRSLSLSPELCAVAGELGFETATPIQAAAIPVLLEGRDLIGKSKTGSGKTAAFALPLLERLGELGTRELRAVVLCPTRELSAQVAREIRKFGRRHPGLCVLVLSGGEPVAAQAAALESGAHVVVGTPGRVLDHLQRRTLKVHRVTTVVVDEADRMLDMGFEEDMGKILKALPASRQTAFFSATFPASIEALSRKHQDDPVRIDVDPEARTGTVMRQLVLMVELEQKLKTLHGVLAQYPHESALVFSNLKLTVAEIEKSLTKAGLSAASLHGDLEQRDRDRVMAKFRNGSTRVLVASDVAARGIDVDKLDLVVNFDLPTQPEIYVHRIGRTGRAGKGGLAVSLCAPAEREALQAIEQFTRVPLERSALAAESRGKYAGSAQPPGPRTSRMVTLRIGGGRKDKLRPGDILGALTGESGGLGAADIGKIEIHDAFSFVAVAASALEAAEEGLRRGKIKGKRFPVARVE